VPDPNWTAEYAWNRSPEGNSFALIDDLGRDSSTHPAVTAVTSGNPSLRRLEVDSDVERAVFKTSGSPGFDPTVGATMEAVLSCAAGSGNAGIEVTFLNTAVSLAVTPDRTWLDIPGGTEPSISEEFLGQDNTSAVRFRITMDGSRTVRVYRDGVELGSGWTAPTLADLKAERALIWGEGGGLQTFQDTLAYFVGGAVAPG